MSVFMSQVDTIIPTVMVVLFFLAFAGIVYLTYHPSKKEKLEKYGLIPLKEKEDGEE